MTDPVLSADEAALQRRRFLRGGALLAAAAGGAVAASASSALPAAAATGGNVLLGKPNTADATTAIESTAAASPALTLTNASGPALRLTPLVEAQWGVSLPEGALAATSLGPLVGLADPDGTPYTSYLATGEDLANTPTTAPVAPRRVWDSKAKKGTVVAKSSSKAVDSKGRLVKGAWVDVKIGSTDDETTPVGAFVTLGSAKSSKDGYLTAYAPGSRPGTLSLSFLKGKTLASGAYVEVGVSGTAFVVRVYASQTTYVTVDLTGLTSLDIPGPDFVGAARQAGSARSAQAARKARRSAR